MNSCNRSCTICGQIFDPTSHVSVAKHNEECPRYSREFQFRKLISDEVNKQKVISRAMSTNKTSHGRLIVHQPDVREEDQVLDGAYTSSILNGLPSSLLVDRFDSSFNPGSNNSKSRGTTAGKRKNATSSTVSNRNESSSSFSSRLATTQTGVSQSSSSGGTRSRPRGESGMNEITVVESDDDAMLSEDDNFPAIVNGDDLPQNHIIQLPPEIMNRNVLVTMRDRVSVETQFGFIHSELEIALIKVASIVTNSNGPHYMYKQLVDWAKTTSERSVLSTRTISYHKLIKNLAEKYGIPDIFPETKKILLPSMNAVAVTTFNFVAQLYSILSDEELMQPKNLIYGDNPFERVTDHTGDHCFNDIETSEWFLKTQRSMCINPNDVLVPICLYIDKTYVRAKPAEAISFCLLIHKRNIRSTATAWRNLGMIPGKLGDLIPNRKFPVAKLGEMRLNDWHYVVNHILTISGFKDAQMQDGLEWEINGKKCRLRIPIMYIVGDIEGHDKVCSRKSGHSKKMKGVTHSCKVRRHECGIVNTECEPFNTNEIKSKQDTCQDYLNDMTEKDQARAELKYLGFYAEVKNAFFGLDYGYSVHGTHGAVAICLLHTFKQKFPNSVLENYLLTYGKSTSTKGCHLLNRSLPRLMKQCLRQSDRNFPKLNTFTVSLLHAKFQINANEKYARMFALSMYLMTTYGWELSFSDQFYTKHDPEIISKRIKLVLQTLTIYKFFAQANFPRRNINLGKTTVRKYMSLYKSVVEWEEEVVDQDCLEDDDNSECSVELEDLVSDDDKCTFPKFHYLLHVLPQIKKFGSALNFDGGSCESNHKYLTKSPGLRTQGRLDTFDAQTSYNLSAKIVLDRAFRYLNMDTSFGVSNTFNSETGIDCLEEETNCLPGISIHVHSSHFYVFPLNGKASISWKVGLVSPKEKYPKIALQALNKHVVVPGWEESVVTGFTCLNWKENIIRAHPSYRSGKNWYDHVNVTWQGRKGRTVVDYTCPGHVYMFLHFCNHPTIPNGLHAIVHSTAVNTRNPHKPTPRAVARWQSRGKPDIFTFWEMEKSCHCIPIACIESLAFVYPDYKDEDMTKGTGFVIEVTPMAEWVDPHNTI